MNKERLSQLYDGAIKAAPCIPILAFVLSLIHELGLSWGLGVNIIRYYIPSDFISISIQFVLLSLLPYLLSLFDLASEPKTEIGPKTIKLAKWAWKGILSIFAIQLLTNIFVGIPQDIFKSTLIAVALLFIPYAIYRAPLLSGLERPAMAVFLLAAYSFQTGEMEGNAILMGKAIDLPEVNLTSPPAVSGKNQLVRLLSSGALIINDSAVLSYVRQDSIASIHRELDRKSWQGLICSLFGNCDFLKGLRQPSITMKNFKAP